MIYTNREVTAFGAGVISSAGETKHAQQAFGKKDFSVRQVFGSDFRTDVLQEKYFVIDSFDQLLAVVPEVIKEVEQLEEKSLQMRGAKREQV